MKRSTLRRQVSTLAGLAVACTFAAPAVAQVDGADDVVVDGTLQHVITDSTEPGAPDLLVTSAVEVDGMLYALPEEVVPEAPSGSEVRLELDANGLGTEEALAELNAPAPAVDVTDVTLVDPAASGTAEGQVAGAHTLTVLPVKWTNATAPSTAASTATLRSVAQTSADYWYEQSAGRIAFGSVDVRDYRTVPAPSACTDAGLNTLFNDALAAHGVAGSSDLRHVVVYFPKWAACGGWAGRATVGGYGKVWVNGDAAPDVFAHELGHNFGLGHASKLTCTASGQRVQLTVPWSGCSVDEYGDHADVMGVAFLNGTTGSLNTALAESLGFASVQTVTEGTVQQAIDIAPLSSVSALRGVRVPISGGDVFVDYRPSAGRDQRKPAWAGVQVHLRTTDGFGIPRSYLLDMAPAQAFAAPALPAGASWAVPSTSTIVTVAGVGATAQLRVGAPAPTTPPSGSNGGPLPVDSPALTRDGRFYFRSSYTDGPADHFFAFGNPGDHVVMGDWDGNGTKTAGVFRDGTWFLRNSNTSGAGDVVAVFGSPGDVPVVGDWDGDGVDTLGVFRRGMWYLRSSNTSGPGDVAYRYGQAGDIPVVGDWDNNDIDTVGVFRGGWWYLTNRPETGIAEGVFRFGSPGDRPMVGDWNRDGTDTLGVFRGGMWYLTNYFDRGVAEGWFRFGTAGDTPLTFR